MNKIGCKLTFQVNIYDHLRSDTSKNVYERSKKLFMNGWDSLELQIYNILKILKRII